MILDLNSHIFAPGQLYVALSRAKSLQGLYLTKPVKYSDIISDNLIFDFLDKVRSFNGIKGTQNDLSPKRTINKTSLSYNFALFISKKETNPSSKAFMLHTLDSFDALFHFGEYEKAYWELQKVVDLMISTYQVDDYSKILETIKKSEYTKEGCKFVINAIFEIYTDVVHMPTKQYQSENRTNPVDLAPICQV